MLKGVVLFTGKEIWEPTVNHCKTNETANFVIDSSGKADASQYILSLHECLIAPFKEAGKYFRKCKKQAPVYLAGRNDQIKLSAFKKGLRELSKSVQVIEGGTHFEDAYKSLGEFLKLNKHIDSLMCANDILALAAMKKIKEWGFSIPKDIAVIGCDNMSYSLFSEPTLSTIEIPVNKISNYIIENLIRSINKKKVTPFKLECSLLQRESS
tara:strand:+ start:582 stop:1214 length:633 start_codon:yes stop_codon:yes gene_type:complete